MYVVIGDGVEEEQAAKKVMDPQPHRDPRLLSTACALIGRSPPFFAAAVLCWSFTFSGLLALVFVLFFHGVTGDFCSRQSENLRMSLSC